MLNYPPHYRRFSGIMTQLEINKYFKYKAIYLELNSWPDSGQNRIESGTSRIQVQRYSEQHDRTMLPTRIKSLPADEIQSKFFSVSYCTCHFERRKKKLRVLPILDFGDDAKLNYTTYTNTTFRSRSENGYGK